MIELYAFARHPGPALPDLGDVFEVPFDGLAALCGRVTTTDDDVTPESLWRHAEIMEALMRDRDLLPVRYGTRLANEGEAASACSARASELTSALEHVSGAVELSLRVRSHEAREAPTDLHERLARNARDAVTSPVRDEGELLRAAYLVDRDEVRHFSDEVARLQAADPDLALLLTGPWPPYSFTEAHP